MIVFWWWWKGTRRFRIQWRLNSIPISLNLRSLSLLTYECISRQVGFEYNFFRVVEDSLYANWRLWKVFCEPWTHSPVTCLTIVAWRRFRWDPRPGLLISTHLSESSPSLHHNEIQHLFFLSYVEIQKTWRLKREIGLEVLVEWWIDGNQSGISQIHPLVPIGSNLVESPSRNGSPVKFTLNFSNSESQWGTAGNGFPFHSQFKTFLRFLHY